MYIYSPEHYSSESYSSPGTSQQQYQEQTGNFDNQMQFEAPATPAANMRITRNTRARMRGMFASIFIEESFILSICNPINEIIIFDFKGGVVQQPKYKEVDTDYVPLSSSRGRGGTGRGRKRAHHSHSLEDEASLYYVIRNNRSSLTVS